MKLRLLVTDKCNLKCPKCCNNSYNLDEIPKFDWEDIDYEEILITGGEPLLYEDNHNSLLGDILIPLKIAYDCPIYMYTNSSNPLVTCHLIGTKYLDGLTVTLHNGMDIPNLLLIDFYIHTMVEPWYQSDKDIKSLRLNLFKKDAFGPNIYDWAKLVASLKCDWKVKYIEWEDNCPVPDNEVFKRL